MTLTMRQRPLRAPYPWYGGKQALAPLIVSLLPSHRVYVEAFGGAGAVLFSKLPGAFEVINDVDSGIYTFLRVLRDQGNQLKALLDLTPCSREEYQACLKTWQQAPTELERARRWYVVAAQAFSASTHNSGWSFSRERNVAREFRQIVDALPIFTARLAQVAIEHIDFEPLFAAYDAPDVAWYCDPPYLPTTRRRGAYSCEMRAADHQRLLETIIRARGKVILSGYRSEMYDTALAGWERIDVPTVNYASNRERAARVECIWLSPSIRRQPSLWAVESAVS